MTSPESRDERFLAIGDYICLYCIDTRGYVFCDRSSSSQNGIYVYCGQSQQKPLNVPSPHVITFKVHIQKRYKLAKRYRRLKDQYEAGFLTEDGAAVLEQAKTAAEAEYQDNIFEQSRLHGKPIRYGDRIQLHHIFTGKNIHVDNTRTSSHDKSRLLVHLLSYDAKAAQFRLLPKYKVNSEGEPVRVGDQVIFESVKTPGQYFHASQPFTLNGRGQSSEFNLGVDASEFTVLRRVWTKNAQLDLDTLWGGAVVQLFHKHLEGYLSAEGIFVQEPTENVHLRVREADLLEPRTLYPPSSCATLWQLEAENSIVDGKTLRWEQRVRLRHLPTRRYLAVDPKAGDQVYLVADPTSSVTVFRLHSKNDDMGDIESATCARIEHVISGTWLHGTKELNYERKTQTWQSGTCKKMSVSAEPLYMDAFYIQLAHWPVIVDYNFISGMVPLFSDIATQTNSEWENVSDRFQSLLVALKEVDTFLKGSTTVRQNRRKLLRDLKVLDLLVGLLQSSSQWSARNDQRRLFETIYEIFYTCITVGDNLDSLYLAQYLDLFLSQIKLKEGFGFYVTRVLVELIRDRREVVERITERQIDSFIGLLKKYEHHRYTQLLSALCVVDGMALPANQSRICDRLIQKNKGCLLCFHMRDGKVMVSKSKRSSLGEVSLHVLADNRCSPKDDRAFLQEQLLLFDKLCHGRNQHCIDTITKETETITWEVAMGVLYSPDITDEIKAQFCGLIISLFIDVGENTSFSEVMTNTFVYSAVAADEPVHSWFRRQFKYVQPELEAHLPQLSNWITSLLRENQYMVASRGDRNKLILSTVRMVRALLVFGYVKNQDIIQWRPYLMNLINGRNDKPFLASKQKAFREPGRKRITTTVINFGNLPSAHQAMVDAKFQVMELLEVMLVILFHLRVARVVALFREVVTQDGDPKVKHKGQLHELLRDDFTPKKSLWRTWNTQEEVSRAIDKIFSSTELISEDVLLQGLMDLTRYEYPSMTHKGLALIQRHFTERANVLHAAKEAKLLTTRDSLALLRTVQTFMPLLRRLLAVKLYEDQMHLVSAVVDRFKECCCVSDDAAKPHYIGQQVLVAHGILPMLLSILDRESASVQETSTPAQVSLVSNTLQLLQLMARNNPDVQRELFTQLSTLLKVSIAPMQLAETLKELFNNNLYGSWRIESNHVKVLVELVATHKERAPAFVEVLSKLIVLDDQGSLLRRNQTLVMKHLLESYPNDAYVFELPASRRRKILLLQEGQDILKYFIYLLNLLVHCGQDNRGSIRSFCQNVLPAAEILALLSNKDICNNLKRPLVKYFSCIYMQSAMASDQRIVTTMHSSELWAFMNLLSEDIKFCLSEITGSGLEIIPDVDKLDSCYCPDIKSSLDVFMCTLFYLTDSVMDFLLEFSRLYVNDPDQFPDESATLRTTIGALMLLCPMLAGTVHQVTGYRTMNTVIQRIMTSTGFGPQDIDTVLSKMEANNTIRTGRKVKEHLSNVEAELSDEVQLNQKLRNFIGNAQKTLMKKDTVKEQLSINDAKLRNREYRFGMTGVNLPLDNGFQQEVDMFLSKNVKLVSHHHAKTEILLRQLRLSSTSSSDGVREISHVDVRCLQILRTTLHNHIVLLPDNWKGKTGQTVRSRLKAIRNLQDYYVKQGIVDIAFGLLNRQSDDVLLEVLALLCCLLFNANRCVQDASLRYFESTKEEVFFMVLINQFHIATAIIKEWRGMQALRQKKAGLLARTTAEPDATLKIVLQSVRNHDDGEEADYELLKSHDDGVIMLMLAVLAMVCDGQHRGMQDYLRWQPDNLRTFNVVAEATQFLSLLCSNINNKNMDLVTQTFNTLTEICQGNQENRVVTLNNKVIDYINTIIRGDTFSNCDHIQVLTLYRALADFLFCLIEESGPEALRVAKEVASTIDEKALLHILTFCYEVHHEKAWPVLNRLRLRRSNKVATSDTIRPLSSQNVALVKRTAIRYYIIIARICDVRPKSVQAVPGEIPRALTSYGKSVASIEIIKDGHLQKIYFPLPEKCHIRDEMKERILSNIDRTSPTNKIRGFMSWSKVLLADVSYSRKVLSNPLTRFVSSQWMLWNYAIIAVSVIINVIMLATWKAKVSMKNVPAGANTLPPLIDDPSPSHTLLPDFPTVLLILGGIHNGFSVLLLVSFFLIHNPAAPKLLWLRKLFSRFKYREKNTHDPGDDKRISEVGMEEGIFTMRALFYLGLVVASFAGSLTHGYFFAAHLLNIVSTNQLLKRVIKAVTQNGRSLIWVAILGLIMLYLYALVGFAFFRASFSPKDQMYCDTLYECSVTIIRYGLIGDIDENLRIHPLKNNFAAFGFLVLYQVTFFIFFTTIGLNIIFGIIVDTFSELRDLKWRAEKDMKETCFMCSRQSYDFEHYSKGFVNHVKREHNMWIYIQYFLYLSDTNPIDYGALDFYVSVRLKENRYDFFPSNRALALCNMDDEVGESKLDDISMDVKFLVQKNKQEEHELRVNKDRYQHERWKEAQLVGSWSPSQTTGRSRRRRRHIQRMSSFAPRGEIISDAAEWRLDSASLQASLTSGASRPNRLPVGPVEEEGAGELSAENGAERRHSTGDTNDHTSRGRHNSY